ncbi:NAD(P)H-binding protein [Phytoactinopolyspora alkaliphila]|uniref:NAD(P)H-binding protein n=1 Tax=Phytoactinopolyspora alkaliphila TaxID=1783498 RepID=A0A6N9YKY0_9ACTN|nr:NAD(P)H-binding protein [Phytoactinopolyspora alkaliphila]NED95602.1 NAD(P)H-binding protein [Phytoactinopolyspora alkaliphila]
MTTSLGADQEDDWNVGVTGVTGKTGRLVAEGALRRGWQVRSLTRRPADVGAWHRFDWDEPEGWDPALRGCDAVYVIIPFNHPGAAERTPDVLKAAAEAGARRIVLLSSLDAEGAASDDPLAVAESALTDLDVEWAILRPTWFLENFSVGSFGAMVREGNLRLPAGEGKIPFISIRDIADVGIAALSPHGPRGRLPLTGPVALTHAEVCHALTDALGTSITFTDATPEEFVELMATRGFSGDYSQFLIDALGQVESGQLLIPVTDTVQRILGRPATSVEEFAHGISSR